MGSKGEHLEEARLEALMQATRGRKVQLVEKSAQKEEIRPRVLRLCKEGISALVATRFSALLKGAIANNTAAELNRALEQVTDFYQRNKSEEFPPAVLSLKVKALMAVNIIVHDQQPQHQHQPSSRHAAYAPSSCTEINLTLLKTMNFIKLKTFLIEKGITRAEVDHCPGKPSLLRLAAEHKFKSLLSDAIDSGNSRQIQNAIDEVNRHYGLDSSTPTDSSTPQGVGDLLETAVRLTKTPSSSSSPATHKNRGRLPKPHCCVECSGQSVL